MMCTVLLGQQTRSAGVQQHGLKGKVKKVISYSNLMSKPDIKLFDIYGNWIEHVSYSFPPGINQWVMSKMIFKYNTSGVMTGQTLYDHNGGIQEDYYDRFKYDDKGNIIERTRYTSDRKLNMSSKFDSNGNMTEISWYDSQGTVMLKSIYRYNDKGKLIEEVSESKGYFSGKTRTVYQYDVNQNLIVKSVYGTDGSLSEKFTSKYDNNAKLTEQLVSTYAAHGISEWRTRYSYDQNGLLSEKSSFLLNGSPMSKTVYKYDARGNKTEETTLMDGVTQSEKKTWEYEYWD